jgi:acyl-coenzyme A synthetase/AMP-(fatty) acid ligase
VQDVEPKVVITADRQWRRSTAVDLKSVVDEVIPNTTVENVVVVEHTGQPVTRAGGRDLWWHRLLAGASDTHDPQSFDCEQRSGKIIRRLLRDLAEGRDPGDTSTLADPRVLDALRD